jgi:hypothetical protein
VLKKEERERNNNLGKNSSIDDTFTKKEKKSEKKKILFLSVLAWNMIDNLIHLYHMMIFDWIQVSLRNSSTSSSSN